MVAKAVENAIRFKGNYTKLKRIPVDCVYPSYMNFIDHARFKKRVAQMQRALYCTVPRRELRYWSEESSEICVHKFTC